MASERLTDEELIEAFDYAHGSLRLTAALSELKERRSQALTDDDRQLVVGYLRNMAAQFANPPKGADPTFYHTLSYEGDVAESARLNALLDRLTKEQP